MKFIGMLIIALLLTTTAHAAKAQPLPPPTVWYVGDSVTYGYAFYMAVNALAPPGWVNVNLGRGGENSNQAVDRVQDLLDHNPAPTIAVLSWGTNDAVYLYSGMDPTMTPDRTAENLVTIALMFQEAGTIPIIGTPIGFVTPSCSPSNNGILTFFAQTTQDQRLAMVPLAQANGIEWFGMEHHSQCAWWDDAFHPKSTSYINDVAPKVITAIHTHTPY